MFCCQNIKFLTIIIQFLTVFEQGTLHFHFALGSASNVASLECSRNGRRLGFGRVSDSLCVSRHSFLLCCSACSPTPAFSWAQCIADTVLFSLPVKALFAPRLSSCDSATPSLGSLGQSESLPPSPSSHLDFLISASPTAPGTVLGREMNRRGFVSKCLHLHVRLLSCWVEGADLPCGLSLFSVHTCVFSSDPYI